MTSARIACKAAEGVTREQAVAAIGEGRKPWDERSDAFVKRTKLGTLAALRTSRARRAFRALEVLHAKGVPCPEPLAWVEGRGQAWLLTRFVEGKPLDVAKEGERAARLAARMHEAGVEHGDFKPANLLVMKDGEVAVLDLDAAKVGRKPPSRRARARDLGALVAYAERHGVPAAKQRAIVDAYLAAAPFETDGAAFARAVLARASTKRERWARA